MNISDLRYYFAVLFMFFIIGFTMDGWFSIIILIVYTAFIIYIEYCGIKDKRVITNSDQSYQEKLDKYNVLQKRLDIMKKWDNLLNGYERRFKRRQQ